MGATGVPNNSQEYICQWFGHMRLSRILIFVAVLLFLVPLIIHHYLSRVETSIPFGGSYRGHRSRSQLETFEDYSSLKASELRMRIDELLRIKASVSSELRDLEFRRQKLQSDVASHTQQIEQLKQELSHQQTDLDRLKISVEQAQVAHREALQRNTPELALPKQLTIDQLPTYIDPILPKLAHTCRMHNCFDYSRCSLTSGFPVYLYETDLYSVTQKGLDVDGFLKTTLKQTLGYNPHLTRNPKQACIFIVLAGEALPNGKFNSSSLTIDGVALKKLPYWGGDGRNHVLLNLARRGLSSGSGEIFHNVDTGRAIIIQSTFVSSRFRPGFDLIVPPILGPPGGDVWHECPPMLPARRKYLLSFQGEINSMPGKLNRGTDQYLEDDENEYNMEGSKHLDDFILDHLKEMVAGTTSDKFYLQFECVPTSEEKGISFIQDWSLCGTDSLRRAVLRDSTFVLILAPNPANVISTTILQTRLYEALRSGAIPVILGGDQILLSFHEVIQWKRACLFLPKARITELHFLLRSVSDADLLAMRRQGRFIWENYLSSVQSTIDVIIAILRDRLGIPAKPIEDIISVSVFNSTFQPLKTDVVIQDSDPEESLGPIEPPYASPAFKRNYTLNFLQGHEIWNDWGDPFHMYPQLPFDILLPSDAKFIGSETGFRPIGKGAGGAGKEFCEALGGNNPREQFTVVMLTYEREQVLINSIGRLKGLPYLNKIVVIWNSPKLPLEDLRWPEIGVPVSVVKAARNSLNNRFLPLDVIETEAVLSVDDDAHLRHDEIIFGFRVWREHRDRVVGFPGRFHAWDLNFEDGWLYNSNYSCEFSMVLTGAAFVHKYYMYLYWYWLPQAIRDKVDEYMNCEDIAMNFLVSHITRKPPVKVTSRWTFRCPGCPVSLSEDDTHFQERHKCINFFTEVFGYTPLLNTQYRADSILFKTRIPHDKQKCFKFI